MINKVIAFLKKPKVYKPLIGMFILYLIYLYLVGLLCNLIVSADTGKSPYNVIDCYKVVFRSGTFLFASVCFFAMIIVVLVYNYRKKDLAKEGKTDERGFKYSKLRVNGTARFMEESEVMDELTVSNRLEYESGFILGELKEYKKSILLPWDKNINHNILVIGGPGTGKSTSFIGNQILQAMCELNQGVKSSLIISDTKGELYEEYAGLAKQFGFKVKILNLVEFDHSDGFQPLSILFDYKSRTVDETMVEIFAKTVIKNTAGEKAGDIYFENLCLNLLEAVILIEFYKYEDGEQEIPTFPSIMSQINNLSSSTARNNYSAVAEEYKKTRGLGNPATRKWSLFTSEEKQVSNTILTLSTRLSTVQVKDVTKMLSHNDIDLLDVGTEPCMYFLRISDQDSTYEFLSSIFLTFLFVRLVAYADSLIGGKLPVRINFLLDEFCNLGIIPDIQRRLSTMRGRNINVCAIIQSLPQLQQVYGDREADAIIGTCDTKLYLGATDPPTKEWISKETGIATIIDEGRRTGFGKVESAMMTLRTRERPLMNPDEVGSMDMYDELIFISHLPVIKARKFYYKNHPIARLLENSELHEKATAHTPLYKQISNPSGYEYTPRKKKFDYVNEVEDSKELELPKNTVKKKQTEKEKEKNKDFEKNKQSSSLNDYLNPYDF